jgi:hypothetical protein
MVEIQPIRVEVEASYGTGQGAVESPRAGANRMRSCRTVTIFVVP